METNPLPLNISHVQKTSLIINRTHSVLHSTALATLIYYRSSTIFQTLKAGDKPIFPLLFLSFAELILSFIWVLGIAYRWRPVSRTAFPDRLPEDEELPAIDVFICTTDPNKEPTVEVMNTVVSAMAMDYPVEKLCVYLSDDGGSDVTLNAMKEAWRFSKCWVPFCRRFGVETRCPEAYFLEENRGKKDWRSDFLAKEEKVKEKYQEFKERVMRIREKASFTINGDHPPLIEVINEKGMNEEVDAEKVEIPLLVYVSREKRPSLPHHFKAGAINVLLRVSAMISNSPYILVLDCDMYCNDPSSARQAMCFHLDPKMSPSLAFVQFPQKFHNISKTDIYDSQLRSVFKILWQGMDGLEGPSLSGTCFYIKRKALYGSLMKEDVDIIKLKESFGSSNDFIKSLGRHYKPNHSDVWSKMLVKETQILASCAYENQTKWGQEVGFLYFSVVEDYFTGFINLHGKGWISVYCDPARPAFLGSGTTNLSDVLVQSTRWSSGLVEVAISRFCPLLHAPKQKEKQMSVLERMCHAELAFFPFYFIPLWCFATIPQLYLLNGIPLYPEVSSWYFIVFSFIFVSSQSKHIQEIFSTGGSTQTWCNEQRMWMIKSVTCHLYGSLDAFMKRMGMREASFLPTNKAVDDEQLKRYQMGKFDFQASNMLIVPVVTLVILNLVSLFGGVTRMVVTNGSFNEMFVQVGLSFFIVSMSYPIVEGMVVRKDKGRVPISVSILSAVISMIYLLLGSLIIMYW
ncbi:Cellulose synthase-like protein G2 [Camellia lanceoleosa]|uniref:Cellulose synthase-like protein G2 n=1 Tax=Camellia lanceoleosa TaxID=1840588 RepID=A0ACC0HEC2_9ERIC|nr:Cellulose synthase-like protein G2 [Camellia lanceoleosa]